MIDSKRRPAMAAAIDFFPGSRECLLDSAAFVSHWNTSPRGTLKTWAIRNAAANDADIPFAWLDRANRPPRRGEAEGRKEAS